MWKTKQKHKLIKVQYYYSTKAENGTQNLINKIIRNLDSI